MQRWNGWGDDTVQVDLPIQGRNLLRELIGEGNAKADYPLEKFINRIPPSRLAHHPLISTSQLLIRKLRGSCKNLKCLTPF